jgi:hypothetical protein
MKREGKKERKERKERKCKKEKERNGVVWKFSHGQVWQKRIWY